MIPKEKFTIHFSDEQIDNLRQRIASWRKPAPLQNDDWRHGTNQAYLQKLVDYWLNEYDWQSRERELNCYDQFTCKINDAIIHFFYIKSCHSQGKPLILTHGWPDSFLRYVKLFPLLPEFDLVVPSLPGFAFSTLPSKGFLNNAEIAELWHTLMTDVLGYTEYIASGGDIGRGVTQFLATQHPSAVRGIHLTDAGFLHNIVQAPDSMLTAAARDYKRRANEWMQHEGAYINIQSTKPQTLSYALADSPVGMVSWMVEKFHAWSDWSLLTMNDILDNAMLYWLTNTACTSIRMYHANAFTLPPLEKITVPVVFAIFPKDVLVPPRECIEKIYPDAVFTQMKAGGHFTAMEQPVAFAENIKQFMTMI
ncbi:MAG: epoxide hydrolase [Treponema sp.]|nr:epoxide hydrolase [Treponema sp.]